MLCQTATARRVQNINHQTTTQFQTQHDSDVEMKFQVKKTNKQQNPKQKVTEDMRTLGTLTESLKNRDKQKSGMFQQLPLSTQP